MADFLTENPGKIVHLIEGLVHIQLLAEVVGVGGLPLGVKDIAFRKVVDRLAVLGSRKIIDGHTGLVRIHAFEAVHAVLAVLVLVLHVVGEPRQEFHVQFAENAGIKLAAFFEAAGQLVERGDGHVVQPVVGNVIAHRLVVLRNPRNGVAVLVHETVVRHGGETGRVTLQQIVGLGGGIFEIHVHAEVSLQPIGDLEGILEIQTNLVVLRINVLLLVVAVAGGERQIVAVGRLAQAQVILLVEGIALGILLHVVVIGITTGCEFIQLRIGICLGNLLGVKV